MTTNQNDGLTADSTFEETLMAFARAFPVPTAADVVAWRSKHERFGPEIAEYVSVLDALRSDDSDGLDDQYAARAASAMAEHGMALPLDRLVQYAGADVASVADAIDIDRRILADIVAGRVHPPVTQRLQQALAVRLGRSPSVVEAAVEASHARPNVGHAFSNLPPERQSVSFRQAVEASSMTDERKSYWLGED